MGLELTWIALAASLLMALGGACLFAYAVRKDYFRDLEEARFHVFWSDLEELVDTTHIDTTQDGAKGNERSTKSE
jgi:hypothetical protein